MALFHTATRKATGTDPKGIRPDHWIEDAERRSVVGSSGIGHLSKGPVLFGGF